MTDDTPGPQTADEQTTTEDWQDRGDVRVLRDGKGRFVSWEDASTMPDDSGGDPQELHGEDVLTKKHGAETDYQEKHGESLSSLNEGDEVHVIDDYHTGTSRDTLYEVTHVPSMEYSFHSPAIRIVEVGEVGPAITIASGKVSKDVKKGDD